MVTGEREIPAATFSGKLRLPGPQKSKFEKRALFSVSLDAVRPYFSGVDVAAGLPKGEFVAFNRDSGATLRGKLF